MTKINYGLIGTIPEVEAYVGFLPALIEKYQANRYENKMDRAADGVIIEMVASHVYGIDPSECDSMSELIDSIRSLDETIQFH